MTSEIEKLIQEWSTSMLTRDMNSPSQAPQHSAQAADQWLERGSKRTASENPNDDTDGKPADVVNMDKELALAAEKKATPFTAPNAALGPDLAGFGANAGLSQQEIDSILGLGDEDEVSKSGFKALTDTRNIGKNRLVLLDVLYERLVRRSSNSLRKFSADNIDINFEQTELTRFGNYLNQVRLPAMICVFRAEEWDNYGLITLDSDLIYSIIEVLLGGQRARGQLNRSRSFTHLDSTLVEKFISVILEDLTAAFDPIFPVSIRLERIETNPRFAKFTLGSNLSHLGRFQVDFDNRRGTFEILFPLSTLEPVREILTQSFMGEKFGRDTVWETHFRSSIKQTFVNLDSLLADMYVPLSSLKSWDVGKIIPLNTSPNDYITLSCNGRALFKGLIGQNEGKVAVQIKEQITRSERSTAPALV